MCGSQNVVMAPILRHMERRLVLVGKLLARSVDNAGVALSSTRQTATLGVGGF